MSRKYGVLYPTLEKGIRGRGTIEAFLAETGLSSNSYYKVITGLVMPRKATIDLMLAYTGLTYEEAFHEKETTDC